MKKQKQKLKNRRLLLRVTDEDFKRLMKIAVDDFDTTIYRILEQFIYDLTGSEYSGDFDERTLAKDWLYRSKK